jgi:3-methyl-2-oxobutanoate hydroxymethyltransferase
MHGKTLDERNYLLESAQALADAGAFAIVLECVEETLAEEITNVIAIPSIGIGAGENCDGQVLVTHDLVGLTVGRVPKFVHPLASLREPFQKAITSFIHRTHQEKELEPVTLSLTTGEELVSRN